MIPRRVGSTTPFTKLTMPSHSSSMIDEDPSRRKATVRSHRHPTQFAFPVVVVPVGVVVVREDVVVVREVDVNVEIVGVEVGGQVVEHAVTVSH